MLDEHERLPHEALAALQLDRLRGTIERVARAVPTYRDRLREVGLRAGDLESLDDLAAIPFTTKDDLREHYPFALFSTPLSDVVRLHASSGTTGTPTVVAYTEDDVRLWAHLMARTLAAGGVTSNDVLQNAYGYGLFTGGLGIHYGGEEVGATVVPMSGGNSARQLMLMRDFQSTVLCCTPSYALSMIEAAEDSGIDVRELSVRVGFFGAEPWTAEMRAEIEARWHITALDIYGLSEIIGPGVAAECEAKDGLHIAEDHFIPEIIDPATGQPLPEGERGELVFTCVTKQALPLLRYRTRDLTRLSRAPCACGRTTVRMERVVGRNDDMLIVRGVNVFPSQIEAAVLSVEGVEPYYEIIVDRSERRLDTLDVRLEASEDAWGDRDRRTAVEERARRGIQETLGITCRIELVEPGGIPRSEGKAARVIDRRG
ncbi:MAG: phenylacetate--CoA ligase [Gemmatimonadetes bacterium]|nr:phenylacetate--CoA ligase [Gemmatimonadota bacterium]